MFFKHSIIDLEIIPVVEANLFERCGITFSITCLLVTKILKCFALNKNLKNYFFLLELQLECYLFSHTQLSLKLTSQILFSLKL